MIVIKLRFKALCFLCAFLCSPLLVSAQQIDDFYIPITDVDAQEFYSGVSTASSSPIISRTDIVVREPNTIIIYDSSADGYESQYNDPASWPASTTTEIWGDNDCSNGFKPSLLTSGDNVCTAGEDVFQVGDVEVLDQTQAQVGDYIRSSDIINVTRSLWPTGPNTLLAGAVELFPTQQWGLNYILPIGEDTLNAGSMFELTALNITSSEDNTAVQVDPDGPTGPAQPINYTLSKGQSILVGAGPGTDGQSLVLEQGATVTASDEIQVNVLTGDIASTYEARFYTLYPNALLSNEYYEPVSSYSFFDTGTGTTVARNTAVFLYNPNSTPITLEGYDNNDPQGTPLGTVTVPANSGYKYIMPEDSGVRFVSSGGEKFTAYTAVDDGGQASDWGHVTTPFRLMGSSVRVGYAPGRDPNSTSNENASPIWVTAIVPDQPTEQVELCIDAGGDGGTSTDAATGKTFDYSLTVSQLDRVRLYDNGPDSGTTNNNGGEQTGMVVFVCDVNNDGNTAAPTDAYLSGAWGQDTSRASLASPGFDAGTTIRTGSSLVFLGDRIWADTDGDGIQDIGEQGLAGIEVTITATNPGIDVDPNTAGLQNTLTVTTDANGNYLFAQLEVDFEYTISVAQPTGTQQTYDAIGILDNQVTLTPNSSALNLDFGYAALTCPTYNITFDEYPLVSNSATAVLIDSEYQTLGADNTSSPLPIGYGFEPTTGGTGVSALYNTNSGAGGADPDLETSNTNNALINKAIAGSTPDADNGILTLNFESPLSEFSARIIDFESTDAVITFYDSPVGTPGNFVTVSHADLLNSSSPYYQSSCPTPTDGAVCDITNPIKASALGLDQIYRVSHSTLFTASGNEEPALDNLGLLFACSGAIVGDTVFTDIDGDGIQDPGEAGLANVSVTITATDSTVDVDPNTPGVQSTLTVQTDANGNYLFNELPFGEGYTIEVTPPAGGVNVSGPDPINDNKSMVRPWGPVLNQDFGYQFPTSVGDTIFYDLDGDGVQDAGELGIPGVEVQMCANSTLPFANIASDGFDGNTYSSGAGWAGVWQEIGDDNSPAVVSPYNIYSTSSALGLDGDEFGSATLYIEREVDLSPATDQARVRFDWRKVGTGFYESTDFFRLQVVRSDTNAVLATQIVSATDINDNFGSFESESLLFNPPSNSSVKVRFEVFDMDSGDEYVYIDNVFVDQRQQSCQTVTTDANGKYLFPNTVDGSYTVTVDPNGTTLPAGLTNTADPDGGNDSTSDLTLSGGNSNLDQDFGYQPNRLISGSVQQDTNGDALGDLGLADVTIQLFSDPNGDGDPSDGTLIATTTTDASGNFLFTGMPVGDYVLVETDRDGFKSVNDYDSSAGGASEASNASPVDNRIPVSVGASENDSDNIFVDTILPSSSINGQLWLDEDQDGSNDSAESTLAGVIVELQNGSCIPRPSASANCPTTITDANGNYSFNNLPSGDYTVVVIDSTLPSGLSNTAGPLGIDPRPVSVGANQQVNDIDFGYITAADKGSIGDYVWNDANGDGIQDSGEIGLGGVTVQLLDNTGSVVATTMTDSSGKYLFTGVDYGTGYTVSLDSGQSALSGYSPTSGPQSEGAYVSAPISIDVTDKAESNIDFGLQNTAANNNSITDTLWVDTDGDGTIDPDETLISGVTVNLYADSDNDGIPDDADGDGFPDVIATTTSDANGQVSFPGLPNGTYIIGITDNDDELQGKTPFSNSAISRFSQPVTLSGGTNSTETSFSYQQKGVISGTVYSDADSDGSQAINESGFANITVILREDTNGDGVYDSIVAQTTTDSDGNYDFTSLDAGNYQVVVDSPVGTQTEDPDTSLDSQTNVSLSDGGSSTGNDFGYNNASFNDLSGTVFNDVNKDGQHQPNGLDGTLGTTDDETGFENVSVTLKLPEVSIIDGKLDINNDGVIDANDDGAYNGITIIDGELDVDGNGSIDASDQGSVRGFAIVNGGVDINGDNSVNGDDDGILSAQEIKTVKTDANGNYSFVGLPDSIYEVEVTDDENVVSGYDLTSGSEVQQVTMSGSDITDIDFGYANDPSTSSISGTVFVDENSNGASDDGEATFSAVDVYLCNAPVASPPCSPSSPEFVAQTTTDANGDYSFNQLPKGNYVISTDPSDIPAGMSETSNPGTISLAEDQNVTDADVGHNPEANKGLLAGVVWTDVDSDGSFDAGEVPIEGVTINVYKIENDGTSTLVGTTTTGPDGKWELPNITPTDNLMVFYDENTVPTALESSQPTNLPTGEDTYNPVNLASDPDNVISYLDFGFPPKPTSSTELGNISGKLYSDTNNDSSYQSGEAPLSGVTVNLLDSNGNIVATTTTDANGDYSFEGLPNGAYQVQITDNNQVLNGLSATETLPASVTITGGADVNNVNAGFIPPSQNYLNIGSNFFFDLDGDSFRDSGEPGIADVVVQCWQDVDKSETPDSPSINSADSQPEPGIDNLLRTVVTDQSGEYSCQGLPAGQYIIKVISAVGYEEANDAATPTGNAADNYAKPWTYVLTLDDPATPAVESNYTADFGVVGNNSVSGKVFIEDESLVEPDGNGTVTAGTELDGSTGGAATDVSNDTPAEGVPVNLYVKKPDGTFALVQSTVTDANGDYSFTRLPDGDYRVVIERDGSVVDAFGQTGDPDLTNNMNGNGAEDLVCDSATRALCDDQTEFTLSNNDANDLNFGYQKNFVTTPVTVNRFASYKQGDQVVFEWESSNEVGHLGFQIYAKSDDDWVLLTPNLIVSGDNLGALETRKYQYKVATKSIWFALIDVSTAEELMVHGPYQLGTEYGSDSVEVDEFDWSKIELKQDSPDQKRNEIKSSVDSRLERLRSLQMPTNLNFGGEDEAYDSSESRGHQ